MIYKWEAEKEMPETKWSGCLTIKMPTYLERAELLKSFKVKMGADGTVEMGTDPTDAMKAQGELFAKHVTEGNLAFDGQEIKKEDLGYYEEGTEVIGAVCNRIMQGVSLSKN